jgi:prophage regulatory protein
MSQIPEQGLLRAQAFLRPAAAAEYLGMGRTKLHLISETDPDFPRKIRFSSRCVGWRKADIDIYLETKSIKATTGAY